MQVLMFSATLHSAEVKSTAEKICQNPVLVDLKVCPGTPTSFWHAVTYNSPSSPFHVGLEACYLLQFVAFIQAHAIGPVGH